MKIGFDAKRAFNNSTGLGNYSRLVILSLLENFPEHQYYLFTPTIDEKFKNIFIEYNNVEIIVPENYLHKKFHAAWRSYSIGDIVNDLKLDIFHGLSNEIPNGINSDKTKTVVTIHDLIFLRYPDYYNTIDAYIYKKKFKRACKNADLILAISKQTKADISDYFKIDEEYNISSKHHRFLGLKNYKYLLYIGLRTSYKNFPIAVEVASRFRNKYKLVVVGEPLNNNEKAMAKEKLGNDYFVVSNLDNKGVNLLYNKAFALLYTSSYEGFGIPLIEAMKTHCPVIASQNSSIPEVAGDGAILCENTESNLFEKSLLKLENTEFRNNLITRGVEQSSKFNWDITFNKYYEFYQELYNKY